MLSIASMIHSFYTHFPTTVAALIGLGAVIAIHEFGHFLFCKLFSIGTPTFSIGFGPQLISKKIGDTTFILSAIPIGGYVEIAGAAEVGQGEQEQATRSDEHSFSQKPFYQQLLVLFGGILFNMLLAYSVFIGLSLAQSPFIGGQYVTLSHIDEDSIVAQSGFQEDDRVISLNDINWTDESLNELPFADRPAALLKQIGNSKEVSVRIIRRSSGSAAPLNHCAVVPASALSGDGAAEMRFINKVDTPLHAIQHGITITHRFVAQTVDALLGLFRTRTLTGVGGPLMIIHMVKQGASSGINAFLFMLGLISISLAVFNLIPLPVLDGGQILFYSIEAITGRPINPQVRYAIHVVTAVILLALILFLSIRDVTLISNSA